MTSPGEASSQIALYEARAAAAEAWAAYDDMLALTPYDLEEGPHPAIDFVHIARSEAERLQSIADDLAAAQSTQRPPSS